jgi:hypothetical protein
LQFLFICLFPPQQVYCHSSSAGYTEFVQAVNGTLELQCVKYLTCYSTGQSVPFWDKVGRNAGDDSTVKPS